jgi:hypothetical protein
VDERTGAPAARIAAAGLRNSGSQGFGPDALGPGIILVADEQPVCLEVKMKGDRKSKSE